MKPIIIPVENGKVTLTLADFRKYMEEAYDQGYRDYRNTNTLTNIPDYSPYWWRDPWYTTTGTATTTTATLNSVTHEDNPNVAGRTYTITAEESGHV